MNSSRSPLWRQDAPRGLRGIAPYALLAALMFWAAASLYGTAATAEYRIQPGDTLLIDVLEDPTLNRSVLVLPDGSINLPLAGSLRAGGRSVGVVEQNLTAALAPNFAAAPTVSVAVAALAPTVEREPTPDPVVEVFIMGEVAEPGKREVTPGTTILQFLAESGGLTPFAAQSRIELHRTNPQSGTTQVYLYSYNGKGRGTRISPATRLAEGDVVIVRARRLFE